MLVEVQPAVRPTRPAGGADHQAEHGVAPAADQVVVGLGQQVVDLVDPLGVELAQRLLAEVAAGVEVGEALRTGTVFRRPAEALLVVAVERRAAAGVAGIEEEVLHVHRDELARIAQLVDVRAAQYEAIVRLAPPALAGALRPAGEIEQARVVGEREAAPALPAAIGGLGDSAEGFFLARAAADLAFFLRRPQARAIVDVGQLVQQGRQQLAPLGAVHAPGLAAGGAAVGKIGQVLAVQRDALRTTGLAHAVGGQVVAPLDLDLAVQAFAEGRRQLVRGFVQELLAGLALRRVQLRRVEFQAQGRRRVAGSAEGQRQQPGAGLPHRARMASASTWSEASRASGRRLRRVRIAASSWAPRMAPSLATKLAASSRASVTTFMSRTEVVVSEVKSMLRSRARTMILLVATTERASRPWRRAPAAGRRTGGYDAWSYGAWRFSGTVVIAYWARIASASS